MSRYIDADDVANAIYHHFPSIRTMADARSIIEEAPSIDIVRCAECKHSEYREDFEDYECHSSGCGLVYDVDFFCADGERREP